MESLKIYIDDISFIYQSRGSDETFLHGKVALPANLAKMDGKTRYNTIMPLLIERFPEIEERWALSVYDCDHDSYYCLIRDDDPDELAALGKV